jgi:outer membrane immunogenic protein
MESTVVQKNPLTLLAAATICLAASQASAADLPRKAPAYIPPAPPPVTWTGCYIGGNIGGAFGNVSTTSPLVPGIEVSTNGSGFAGGGQIGCDYQFAGNWVFGFRNMYDWTSNKKSGTVNTGVGPLVANFNNQWFDTLTGRVGYAVAPTWLLYFQGGAAWAHTSTNVTFNGLQVGQTSHTGTGWTIGGGAEWMFTPQWSAFLEANYMDLGSRDGTAFQSTFCPAGCAFSTKATEITLLAGVNYRFNWGNWLH